MRAAIGVTGQFSAVDNLLTGEENLILMADLHRLGRAEGRRRCAELIERFDLAGAAKKTPATYPGGMRRRLDLVMTLVAEGTAAELKKQVPGSHIRLQFAGADSLDSAARAFDGASRDEKADQR